MTDKEGKLENRIKKLEDEIQRLKTLIPPTRGIGKVLKDTSEWVVPTVYD